MLSFFYNHIKKAKNEYEDMNISDVLNVQENRENIGYLLLDYLSRKCDHLMQFHRLTAAEKNIYLSQIFVLEVINGGFSQFYNHIGADYCYETYAALKAIRAYSYAKLLDNVNALFHEPIHRERSIRQQQLTALKKQHPNVFDKYDNAFYQIDCDFDALCYDYVMSHIEEFS